MQFLGIGGSLCRAFIPVLDHVIIAVAAIRLRQLWASQYSRCWRRVRSCFVSVLKCSLFGELLQNCLGGTAVACMQSVYD